MRQISEIENRIKYCREVMRSCLDENFNVTDDAYYEAENELRSIINDLNRLSLILNM